METVIETRNLTKRFGTFSAVEGVSLSVPRGEIYGFLGLNGAGKTTTIRMLLGLIRPSAGSARVCGETIRAGGRGPWRKVGSLVELPHSYPELTVKENLEIIAGMRTIRNRRAVEETLDTLKLSRYADKKAGKLSLGNAQRLGLAKALVHKPEVLILDEPANGLDPAGIVEIRRLLIDLATTHSVTVFVSSHILDEVARLANRIGIIHNGRLVREVTANELHALRARHLRVTTRNNARAREVLAGHGYAAGGHNSDTLELTDETALTNPENVSTVLVNAGVPPVSLYEKEDDLERFFLKTIGDRETNHA